jgi:predicted TIM-barrel fold metal-dependent hydrolase
VAEEVTEMESAGLSDADRKKFYQLNAQKVFGL